MLTYMQKHKKYLVVTIWISVIAFVGAGFVGWGNVDLNISRSSSIAKVGSLGISPREFQLKYSELFAYFAQSSENGDFSEEDAKANGLAQIALNSLIQEKLLLNYAQDLGFYISEGELAQAIRSEEIFSKEGSFSQEHYSSWLKNQGLRPVEHEEMLKNQLMIRKFLSTLKFKASKEEAEMFYAASFMKDAIDLVVVKATDSDIDMKEELIKAFWEEHKNDYKSKTKYEISLFEVEKLEQSPVEAEELQKFYSENKNEFKDNDGKILDLETAKEQVLLSYWLKKEKTQADKNYIALKKSELEFAKKLNIDIEDDLALNYISKLKEKEIGRPFLLEDNDDKHYVIARLESISEPRVKSFEEASQDLEQALQKDYIKEQKKSILETKAKEALKDLNEGKALALSIDKVSKYIEKEPITELSSLEYASFIDKVFSSKEPSGFVSFEDLAIAYKITEQSLLDNPINEQLMAQIVQGRIVEYHKAKDFDTELLDTLRKKYAVQNYAKVEN